jgi:hypothetical protein
MSECGDLGSCFGGCNDAPAAVPSAQPITLESGIDQHGNGGGRHLSSSSKQPNFKQPPICYPNSPGSAAKVSGANAPFKSSRTGSNNPSDEKPPPLPLRHPLPAHNPKASFAPVFHSESWRSNAPDIPLTPSFGGSLGQYTSITSEPSYLGKPPSVYYSKSGFDYLGIDDGGYTGVSWLFGSSGR